MHHLIALELTWLSVFSAHYYISYIYIYIYIYIYREREREREKERDREREVERYKLYVYLYEIELNGYFKNKIYKNMYHYTLEPQCFCLQNLK